VSDSQHGDRPAWWTQMARENERLRAELAALKATHAALREAAADLSTVGMAAFGELHNFARDLDVISSTDNTAVRRVASKLRDAIERTDAALVTEEK
jgi:hypothetical protein